MSVLSFFRKLNNKHFFSLAGNMIISLLSLVIMGILYRKLPSKADVGTWILFQTVLGLVDTIRTGFLTTAAIRFYAGAAKERANEVTGSTWYLATVITGIVLLLNVGALFLLYLTADESVIFIIKWLGISFLLSLPVIIANCTLQGEDRFDRLLYMRSINQGSFLLFILVLLAFDTLTLETVLYAYLSCSLLTSLFVMTKGWTHLHTWKNKTNSCIKELYNFGRYTVGTTISSNLLRSSDIFIIKFLFPRGIGEHVIAIYRIGLLSLEIVEIPLRSFIATAMTSLSAAENQNKKEYFIYLMKKYTGILTMLIIPAVIGAWLLADLVVYIMAGKEYFDTEAGNVIRIFMTFALLFPFDRFFALSLDVLKLPRINYYKVVLMLAVNVAGDFIGYYIARNIYGIAIATFLPTLVGVAVGYYYLRKQFYFTIPQIISVGYVETKEIVIKTLRNLRILKAN
jgi:O-antigen/teichoic acid export membrane protein